MISSCCSTTNSNHALYKKLIDQLVIENDNGGFNYNSAFEELKARGKDAWPSLFDHLEDERPSELTISDPTIDATVGHNCLAILYYQIVDIPWEYCLKASRFNRSNLEHKFKPSIKEWLLARSEQSLTEIKIGFISDLINEEKKFDYQDSAVKQKNLNMLKNHLKKLKSLIKEEKSGKVKSYGDKLNLIVSKARISNRSLDFCLIWLKKKLDLNYIFLDFKPKETKEKITIHGNDISLKQLLDIICKENGIEYEIGANSFIFTKKAIKL